MLSIKPTHEALLAALLMVLALVGLGGVVAHDYAGRLPPGVVDDMYQDPMLSILAGASRTRTRLAALTPLGDLDKLYTERVLSADAAESVENGADPVVEDDISQETEFRVTGIAWSNRRPMAFINGKGVTIGQSIDGWRVTGIAKQSVTLADDEGTQKQIGLYQGKSDKRQPKPNPETPKPSPEKPILGNDANY